MIGHNSQYSNLKMEVLKAAGNVFSLTQIKEHFASAINSKRALSRVDDLESFLCLLEERDLLNSRNISCLKKLAEILENDKIKKMVHTFKKLYLDDIEDEPCFCRLQTSIEPDTLLISQVQENNNNRQINSDLTQALNNLSETIGKQWVFLARELKIEEGIIENIRLEYPNEFKRQALAAWDLWLRKEKHNASIELLKNALVSTYCKRMGLVPDLLNPTVEIH